MYESAGRDITIATTGDAIITRKLRVFREKPFLALIDLLRKADVSLTNLENPIRTDEGYPKDAPFGCNPHANPMVLEDLKWAGISMVSCANNHADDWGDGGILSTIHYLDQVGLVHAGTGRNLDDACMPAYLDTPKGRVALISVDTTGVPVRAIRQRPDCLGRPGVNVLRRETTYTVDKKAFDQIARASNALGLSKPAFFANLAPKNSNTEVHLLDRKFQLGDSFAVHTAPNQEDLTDIMMWVSEARRQADWVIVFMHMHEDEPPDFVKTFVHACIDAGVDLVCNGAHKVGGIELFQGKPVLYAMGNFVFELETMDHLPYPTYKAFRLHGLGPNTPADYCDARTNKDTAHVSIDRDHWESVAAVTEFKSGKLKEVKLYPLYGGFKTPRSQRGRPVLAEPELGKEILARVQERSKQFGTEIAVKDGVGIVRP